MCRFCDEYFTDEMVCNLSGNKECVLLISDGKISITFNNVEGMEDVALSEEINYCPFCGRCLKAELEVKESENCKFCAKVPEFDKTRVIWSCPEKDSSKEVSLGLYSDSCKTTNFPVTIMCICMDNILMSESGSVIPSVSTGFMVMYCPWCGEFCK